MKQFWQFFCFFLLFLSLGKPIHRLTRGFTPARVAPAEEAYTWPTEELTTATFDEPLRLIADGPHSYIFSGPDYVVKLLKNHRFAPTPIVRLLGSEKKRLKKEKKCLRRKRELLKSLSIASHELPEETGLVALHLSETKTPLPATLIDKSGVIHHIDLSKCAFVVQKKAILADAYIIEKWKKGDGKMAICQLIDLVKSRCEKGIFDKDPDFCHNFGFVGAKPIELHLCRFSYDSGQKNRHQYSGEIYRITREMRSWLQEHCPDLVPTFDEKVKTL